MEKKKFDKNKYDTKYHAQNTIRFNLALSKKYDADIIKYLEKLENKNGKIKELIREEIRRKN